MSASRIWPEQIEWAEWTKENNTENDKYSQNSIGIGYRHSRWSQFLFAKTEEWRTQRMSENICIKMKYFTRPFGCACAQIVTHNSFSWHCVAMISLSTSSRSVHSFIDCLLINCIICVPQCLIKMRNRNDTPDQMLGLRPSRARTGTGNLNAWRLCWHTIRFRVGASGGLYLFMR